MIIESVSVVSPGDKIRIHHFTWSYIREQKQFGSHAVSKSLDSQNSISLKHSTQILCFVD